MSKSISEWEDSAFEKIFKFGLKPGKHPDFKVLENLANELVEEYSSVMDDQASSPLLLTSLNLDQALVEFLNGYQATKQHESISEYLIKSYNNSFEIKNNLIQRGSLNLDKIVLDQRVQSLDFSMSLITNYLVLSLVYQDMFNGGLNSMTYFIDQLIIQPQSNITDNLLNSIISTTDTDMLNEFITILIKSLNERIIPLTISQDYQLYFKVLFRLFSNSKLLDLIINSDQFLPSLNIPTNQIELDIILGPILRISTYPDATNPVHQEYFQSSNGFAMSDIQSTLFTLRNSETRLISSQFELLDKIVRSSSANRIKLLKLISNILKLNQKRSGIQFNKTTLSSDRFILSIFRILIQFSLPFLDNNHSKIDKIDLNYLLNSDLIDLNEEATLGSNPQQLKIYLNGRDLINNKSNFISDIFNLTLLSLHLGLIPCLNGLDQLQKEIEEMENHIERFEQGRSQWQNQPTAAVNEHMLKRITAKLIEQKALNAAIEGYLTDPNLLNDVNRFYNLVMTYLVRLMDPNKQHPNPLIKLPAINDLNKVNENLINLPEYYISDIVNYYSFIAKECPETLLNQSTTELVQFVTVFLNHDDIIINPHLKIKLVEILFYLTFPLRNSPEGIIGSTINCNGLALQCLLPSLLHFYVSVEQTGLSSQFHDKFNVRYHISQLLKILWKNPIHQEKLRKLSEDMDFFIRFVNLLMNDTTYLLDESLTKLNEIHNLQTEMEDHLTFSTLPPEQRAEKERQLASSERMAKSYVALSNDNVNMLLYITDYLPLPFLSPEIVTRLAAMLNYTLEALVGPKCHGLKVRDRDKYRFSPKSLLTELMKIYLHLNIKNTDDIFKKAVAKDGRSYSKLTFERALSILSKHQLLEFSILNQLNQFLTEVENIKLQDQILEKDLGEIPDEFLDELMFTIMTDPVKLPISNRILDLSTIKAHLLSDSTDPFNRQPLKLDQVIPLPDLKIRIQEFIKERIGN